MYDKNVKFSSERRTEYYSQVNIALYLPAATRKYSSENKLKSIKAIHKYQENECIHSLPLRHIHHLIFLSSLSSSPGRGVDAFLLIGVARTYRPFLNSSIVI